MIAKPITLMLAALLTGCAATTTPTSAPKMAITIDDLPTHAPFPPGVSPNDVNFQLIDALVKARVPGVTAFVNAASVEVDPSTEKALDAWRDAGIPLGNHGWSHKNLNDLTVTDYEREIERNEPVLAALNGRDDFKWYRFPYLAEGDDPAKRLAVRTWLADHGYRIASVSMSFSDWQWSAPYARCTAAGDRAAMAELERTYMEAAKADIDYSRLVSKRMYGRDIPHVLLLHVGGMTAHMMPRLLDLYRREGFQFVSLAEAQSDPAYAEDNDPRLPPRNQFFAPRARDLGIALPPEPDYSRVMTMCPGAGPATSTP
ncbi:polysaccharide deacetylase family protein [Sphingomonas rhizophila]|uniref:Chitooligosaccharide deacetylase n=1 Tax=Sphingomonas rhizophila TaxID=2071607 RepID=A0A7G9SBB9_9SPHN|nr:polysaccharide deacetylase family protein [Sphingomonas rhizophila]QNN65144.1 polysaccharide deacetylase family protein [Sphingomonas rhizophila]